MCGAYRQTDGGSVRQADRQTGRQTVRQVRREVRSVPEKVAVSASGTMKMGGPLAAPGGGCKEETLRPLLLLRWLRFA